MIWAREQVRSIAGEGRHKWRVCPIHLPEKPMLAEAK
jgi:hypothetical protein